MSMAKKKKNKKKRKLSARKKLKRGGQSLAAWVRREIGKKNPRAGSKPYWIAYIDTYGEEAYGEPLYARIHSFDEERTHGKVFARSYKASVVKRAVKSMRRRLAKENPRVRRVGKGTGWIKAKAVRVVKRGNKIDVQVKR